MMLRKFLRNYAHLKPSHLRKFSTAEDYITKTPPELISVENQYEVLEDAVTPLCRIPYEKQLEYKQYFIADVVKDLRVRVIAPRKSIEISPIIASPITEHYRNKDEYNVRMGVDGDPITYGLFTGKPVNGMVYAVRPIKLSVIKSKHNEILGIFEKYVKKSSLPPCYNLNDGGFWRRVVVRSNLEGETMLVICNHPQNFSQESILNLEKEIVEHFASHNCRIESIYHFLSKHVRCVASNSQVSLIHGVPFLYENLLDNRFRISPDSFFQINVKAAELLHQEVLKLAELKDNMTLLDLCCGVGTFSIAASKHVRHCIGIESSFSSIEDAIHNAAINNAANCEFIPGNVETRLLRVLDSITDVSDFVVIANPGRNGLHPRVIEILRSVESIRRIIYISCKPDHLLTKQNFLDLLKTDKTKKTKPFNLKKIKTVDLFPHTYHYEMILLFER